MGGCCPTTSAGGGGGRGGCGGSWGFLGVPGGWGYTVPRRHWCCLGRGRPIGHPAYIRHMPRMYPNGHCMIIPSKAPERPTVRNPLWWTSILGSPISKLSKYPATATWTTTRVTKGYGDLRRGCVCVGGSWVKMRGQTPRTTTLMHQQHPHTHTQGVEGSPAD